MIAYIKGKVIHQTQEGLIVETGGLGYMISVLPDMMRQKGQEVELFVYSHTTQDGTSLFGFNTPEALDMFATLLRVQGLGPANAMRIMAGFSVQELRQVIQSGDAQALRKIKGVGPKLADKIIFFLRGKLPEEKESSGVITQAVSALVSLGMKESEARKAAARASSVLGQGASVEEIVKSALRGEG